MVYRKDIQMLRGIAVLLVVFFHLEVPGFNSGFLGVDVFFVISGYLMAVMYNPTKKKEFFVKRAKRLLPAYFAVVLVTLLLALVITVPSDFSQISSQAVFATFFASNIGFWLQNSYFDKAAFKPLLHLWSLGVEIQFYLLVPAFYWLFKKIKVSYLLVLVVSALLCFLVLRVSPNTSFFLLPFRIWEFLIGFGVAKYIHKERNNGARLAWFGCASMLIIIGISFANINGVSFSFLNGHPGLASLSISLATAGYLSFGIPEKVQQNPISGVLEKLGGYSYSIYLAHFPVIVLYLYQPFGGTVLKATNIWQSFMLAALVISASAILYGLIEKPFRSNKYVLRWSLASAIVVFSVSFMGVLVQKMFIPEREMLIYQAWTDRGSYRCGKMGRIINPTAISCEITKPNKAPSNRVLFVGNSHADSVKTVFAEAAQAKNVSLYFMAEGIPLMTGGISPQNSIKEAQTKNADSIVLHYSPGSIDYKTIGQLAIMAKDANIHLAFVMPVPVWGKHIPTVLLKNLKNSEVLPIQSFSDYANSNSDLINGIEKLDSNKLRIYNIADIFCKPTCRLISDSGKPLYFDTNHLTLTGGEMLMPTFDRVLLDLPPAQVRD